MKRARILLVEDSPTQAIRVSHLLEQAGHEVAHAATAEQAIALLSRGLPDLLLLDYHLPGLQGPDLCRLVRLQVATLDMPILMLTADRSPQCQREGLDSGADDFLPKTGGDDLLLDRVGRLLGGAGHARRPGLLPTASFHQPRVLCLGLSAEVTAFVDAALRAEGFLVTHAAAGTAPEVPAGGVDCVLLGRGAGADALAALRAAGGPGQPPACLLVVPRGEGGAPPSPADLAADDILHVDSEPAVLRARLRALLRRRFVESQNRALLEEFRNHEGRALRLEAERDAAEARAALAGQLALANEELAHANERLAHQAQVTRAITDNVTSALLLVDGAGRVTFQNPAATRLLGFDAGTLGPGGVFALLGAEGPPPDGEPVREQAAELALPGGTVPVTVSLARLPASGDLSGTLVELVDVTERRRAEQRQALLMAELSHRVKNTLATVSSIFEQTRRRAASIEALADSFRGRIQALSATHNLLSQHHWGRVGLADLLRHETGPYVQEDGARLRLELEPVELQPRAALTLSLVFHELATNAVKYGALGRGGGQIHLTGRVDRSGPEPALHVTWQERGGPPVQPPSRRGFGTTLIELSVAYELGGTATVEFEPEGLRCTLRLPLSPDIQPVKGKPAMATTGP